jgi:hypothetical protein
MATAALQRFETLKAFTSSSLSSDFGTFAHPDVKIFRLDDVQTLPLARTMHN